MEKFKALAKTFLSLLFLVVWVMNLVGTTGYIFWASNKLIELGESAGFNLFGVLNLIVSLSAFPLVKKCYMHLVSNK